MKRGIRFHFGGRKLITSVMAVAAMLFGLVALVPSANAALDCGSSKYVEKIEVVPFPDRKFQIQVTPTPEARWNAFASLTPRDAAVKQWHAIQRCVTGLSGALADTIWDQLECHQLNSYLVWKKEDGWWLTGSTYDLESWAPTLPRWVSGGALIFTECLNRLEVSPGDARPLPGAEERRLTHQHRMIG